MLAKKYSPQQIQAAVAALKAYDEKPFVPHQWEELVYHLCRDNDPKMRDRMYREMDEIMKKDPGFSSFRER
jgi:hypothetical protein